MKTHLNNTIRLGCCALMAAAFLIHSAQAQAPAFGGHYPAGVEGIKAGSLPPPGIYLRQYNWLYFADKYPGGPPNFDIFVYVNAPRLVWISEFEILGGNYGADVLLPFGYADVQAGPFRDRRFSLGDIHVEPITLSWRLQQFDAAVGYAIWAPTGNHRRMAGLGKGFWSHMFTAGATWYPDAEKTWALSALNRYEIHTKHRDLNITPGDTYTLEGGLSKSIRPTIDVGAVGYYQGQVTRDRGPGASGVKDRVAAAGPEVAVVCPRLGLITSLRYLREFAAKDRPEGNVVTLTFTKRF
jgi:hypothetical protein